MLEEIHKSFIELRDVLLQVLRYPHMKTNMKAHKDSSIIVFAALALVILFAGIWLFMASPSTPSATVATTTAQTTGNEATTTAGSHATGGSHPAGGGTTATIPPTPKAKFAGVGSLDYLVSVKETLTCNVETTSATPRRIGTVFISGTELRGDFSSYFNGATRTSHMIDDGSNLYVWVNGYDSGLKLPSANGASGSAAANAGGIDPTVNVAFACYPWTLDSSIFTKPSDVTFTDSFGH